ncbi:hypothetical protein [Thermogemmatispora tikiterensis]|uniref:Uncharacterized protein n=1 Tax=Thermogemmatispora tikiterensis TaxID=1825093 RepID=A0A328VW60_9CHLR|nr:hypothetical protein [Thermogemmatispora tikiterensis]RAQ98365.1 hypothetical protein A4R35_22685 [Thermogemmatispora tikiterensis]
MNDPRILLIFGLFFVALGGYNLVVGRRRLRAQPGMRPFQQVNILTGSEYLLLALVFFINALARTTLLPSSVTTYLFVASFVLLIISLVLAVMVVRMATRGRPAPRQNADGTASAASADQERRNSQALEIIENSPELEAARRRERRRRRLEHRRKMAEQRRRRAGKA